MPFQTLNFCSYFIKIMEYRRRQAHFCHLCMSYTIIHVEFRDGRREGRADKDSIESETESQTGCSKEDNSLSYGYMYT